MKKNSAENYHSPEKIDELIKKLEEYENTIRKFRNGKLETLTAPGPSLDREDKNGSTDHTYRIILETLNEGVATVTPDGMVLFCNHCLAQMLDLPVESILGRSVTDFCTPADRPVITDLLRQGLNNKCKTEIVLRDAAAATIPVQVSCNSLHLDSSVLCLVFMDLRALKDAGLKLQQANAKLEQKLGSLQDAAELKKKERLSEIGTLAATVAHELRNPLAVIGIIAYNLRRETGNRPELAKYIEDIEKKINQSSQIIDNLLNYSRIKLPQFEDIPIYELINNCLVETREKFKDKAVQISTDISGLKKEMLWADLFQINQILNNLFRNAWEAAPRDGGRVGVSGRMEEGNIIIQIEDNGHGIPPEHMENVFKPFFTLKSKGTGLGLSVCREMVHLHDGKIMLSSIPGKGTTAILSLPKRSSP